MVASELLYHPESDVRDDVAVVPPLPVLVQRQAAYARGLNARVLSRCHRVTRELRRHVELATWTSPRVAHLAHTPAHKHATDAREALAEVCGGPAPVMRFDAARRAPDWVLAGVRRLSAVTGSAVDPVARPRTRSLCILDEVLERLDDESPELRTAIDVLVRDIVWVSGVDAATLRQAYGAMFLGAQLPADEMCAGLVRETEQLVQMTRPVTSATPAA